MMFILSNFNLLDPSCKQLDDENNNIFYTNNENCRTSSPRRIRADPLPPYTMEILSVFRLNLLEP